MRSLPLRSGRLFIIISGILGVMVLTAIVQTVLFFMMGPELKRLFSSLDSTLKSLADLSYHLL